jgi:hypothetical protein
MDAAGVAGAFAAVIENVAGGRLTCEMLRKAIETGKIAEAVKKLAEKAGIEVDL